MANKHLENGVIKSKPKSWSKTEVEALLEQKKNGLSFFEISKLLIRTEESCKRKFYKNQKKVDKYNNSHRELKYNHNKHFIQQIDAKTILDAYSGGVSWYKINTNLEVVDNDIKIDGADYKLSAEDFLYKFKDKKIDIVDLDPFGSAFECFDLALQIAQKGLIITFGEIVSRRFNRMDFVEYRYGIKTIEDFTTKKLSAYIESRGLIFRKKMIPIIKAEMTNISRIYYKIDHFDYGNSGCKYFPKIEKPNLFNQGI